MRKFVICLFVCTAAMAFFCAVAHAQEDDAEENIRRIERALKELAKEENPSDADKKLRSELEESLKRLKDTKKSLEEMNSELQELNKQAQQVLNEFGKKALALAEKAIKEEDYAGAAELLNEILEADPDNTKAEETFEKIMPSVFPAAYRNRWYWAYSRMKERAKVETGAEGYPASTSSAVNAALRWLHFHQDKDGKWDQDGFQKNCDTRKSAKCDGKGTSQYDVGVSSLALLAFMGSGYTHRVGDFKETVKKGLGWLLSQQQKDDGSFGERNVESWIYNHAIATQALCEAYALTLDPKLKSPCEKAVEFILKAQNKDLGWKYEPKSGRNDTSVTGWMVMALKAANTAGFKVPDSAFKGALAWFDSVTNTAGKCGYMRPGDDGWVIRGLSEHHVSFPSMTAVSVLCRIFCGQKRTEKKITKGVDLLMKNLPDWNKPKNDKVDFYYWFFGTYAMFQHGNKKWYKWNTAMKKALLDTQRVGGCPDGSWDPVGKWGMVGGRVYATAINCLTLEVNYRYTRAGSDEKKPPEDKQDE